MKEQLELKHLAPYLTYGLKASYQDDICLLDGISSDSISVVTNDGGEYTSFQHIKPILHPLSDLTKEIEHNGEKFVPIDKLELEGYVIGYNGFSITIGQEEGYSFGYAIDVYNQIIRKLHEWHFDVFGLIDKGLAISYEEAGL